MATEIELKLSVSPDDAKKLARLPPVKGAARGRARRHELHSVYYDTPELDLRRTRVALRLRRDGARWIQTLKGNGRVEAGLHERIEQETPVAAQILDYRAIAQSGLSEALADPDQRVRLQPVFVTDISRITRRLQPAPGTEIELCVDAGQIRAGERSVPISELELELKAGPPAALLDFAAQLLVHLPMRLEPLSKAERGYALVQGNPPAPVKAAVPHLDAQMSVTHALRVIVASCVSHLQANEPGVLVGADEEYLHQARVALRRLRSALSVFQPAFPRAALETVIPELRWLTGCLGPARDWDVFALDTLRTVSAAFPGDAGLAAIAERAAGLRAQAGEHARQALASRRYTALLLELTGLFLREPWQGIDDETATQMRALMLRDFAQQVLQRRHRKAIKRGKRHAQLDAPQPASVAYRYQEAALRGGVLLDAVRTQGRPRVHCLACQAAGTARELERRRDGRTLVRVAAWAGRFGPRYGSAGHGARVGGGVSARAPATPAGSVGRVSRDGDVLVDGPDPVETCRGG